MINDQLHRQVVEQAIVDGLKQYFVLDLANYSKNRYHYC